LYKIETEGIFLNLYYKASTTNHQIQAKKEKIDGPISLVNMYAKILNKNIRKQYPITYENNYAQ
jgi:hypothetical protein